MNTDLLDRFAALVGPKGILRDAPDVAPYLVERRGLYQGSAGAVLRPGSVQEVSAVLTLAQETGTPIVPQGGNTGLVGGQVAFDEDALVLSLGRLNKVRHVDALNNTLTVDAGVTLAQAQEAAAAVDRLFPLSMASEGSCQIGGNLATNAGGTAVLRYGTARDLVLGLEVVLSDGRIWDGLTALRKNNTGYDLKQLFLGSEGTLGIITGAVLKLFPAPKSYETAFVALPGVEAAIDLLRLAEEMSGGRVTAFEIMPRIGLDMVARHETGVSDPLDVPASWYGLIELSSGQPAGPGEAAMAQLLDQALEKHLVSDGVVAQSEAQRAALWRLREALPEAQRHEGGSIKHDISVPVSAVAAFIDEATKAVTDALPGIRPVPFGHVGDGNVHFNLSQPEGMDTQTYLALWGEMNARVHAIALAHGGSISAEHGIGVLKRDELAEIKAGVEMDMMRVVKRALDPANILNPGKVLKP